LAHVADPEGAKEDRLPVSLVAVNEGVVVSTQQDQVGVVVRSSLAAVENVVDL
jgi:hypothetical protein